MEHLGVKNSRTCLSHRTDTLDPLNSDSPFSFLPSPRQPPFYLLFPCVGLFYVTYGEFLCLWEAEPCSICLSVSGLFHLARCPPGSSTGSLVVGSPSFYGWIILGCVYRPCFPGGTVVERWVGPEAGRKAASISRHRTFAMTTSKWCPWKDENPWKVKRSYWRKDGVDITLATFLLTLVVARIQVINQGVYGFIPPIN